ncbi:MAG: hypothetical protein IJE89_04180 [Bacilli bacterium]|nr:hypothetical protein [Bacilli bacterium]
MEKQNNNKGVIALLVVIIVILATLCVLFATGTINFNSSKVNDNNVTEENNNNSNQPNDTPTNDQDSSSSTNNYFSAKYKNISDDKSYIIFKEDGTFEAIQNQCEGYSRLIGTFGVENGEIILTSDYFYSKKNVLTIETNDENAPILLFDKDGAVANCSGQGYYVIEEK